MLSAILGPSGSERRVYCLVALTVALMPVMSLITWLVAPLQTAFDIAYIGTLAAGVLVWGSVMCYGAVRVAVTAIQAQTPVEAELDTDPIHETAAA
mgnify:CR=1 FL=1|jgi:hypothetical protein